MTNILKPLKRLSGMDSTDLSGLDSVSDTTQDWYAAPRSSHSIGGGVAGPANTSYVLYGDGVSRSGGAAGAGGPGNGGTTTTTTTAGTGSPFVIKITWDASVANAPTAFKTAVTTAVQYLESQFTDAVTINISVGYGEVNGTSLGSYTLGASQSYLSGYTYSTVRTAMAKDATSTDDQSAVASLPTTSPTSGSIWTTTAEGKALGLVSATKTATDGFVGFSSSLPFTYSGPVAAGTYDFNGVVLHELTEVMGRILLTNGTIGSYANSNTPGDLMHYSSVGVRDFSASTPGYFSVDGGASSLGSFNTVNGGDAGDWASGSNDSFNAFSSSGVTNAVTPNDLRVVDAIGWNRAGIVTAAPVTAALAAAQGTGGLNPNAPLIRFSTTSVDAYTLALTGTGAASFTLSDTTNNTATLSAGTSGVAGGRLYALAVTATDTTTDTAGPATPFDVILGSGNGDSVSVATLTGALGTATPTFIYGLAGKDTLNGTGMTGREWFVGGAGADTMTGGSGANTFLYAAVTDSQAGTVDQIANFHVGTDVIDLTGLGTSLTYAGKISGTSLAAGSVGWTSGGGKTTVYVNTSAASESLSAANMQIGLSGSLSLSASNIVHL